MKGIFIFFNVASNYKYIRVFKLLMYLGVRARTAVLLRGLHTCNLLLLEGPSCFGATAFHKVSVEFPFRLSRDFKREKIDINKQVNKYFYF